MAIREINLIPADILAGRHLFRHLFFWAVLLTISLALIFGFHLYQTHVALAQKSPFQTLKEVNGRLSSRIEEIKRLQGELESLNQHQSVLEKVTGNLAYSWLLLKLANMMNGYTWLTQLAIDGDKETKNSANLRLSGFSFRNEELGNFIDQLSGDPIFKDVSLKYARETRTNQLNRNMGEPMRLIQFQIECKIVR